MSRPTAPASLTLAPPEVDFGAQTVGTSTQPKAVALKNTSKSPVKIHDISASGIDFTETDNCPPELSPGGQCALQVTFKPAITGPRMGTIIVTDSDPNPTLFLVLTGNGQ